MPEKIRYTVIPRTLIFVFRNEKLLLMKFSGKGENQTQEKEDRKDMYNPIGGHIEENENIIENTKKEAMEEAGVNLISPKIRGIINVNSFAGKNIMLFVVKAETTDEGLKSTLEGELEWVDPRNVDHLNLFKDLKLIIEKVIELKDDQMFVGTSKFDGKFGLVDIQLATI